MFIIEAKKLSRKSFMQINQENQCYKENDVLFHANCWSMDLIRRQQLWFRYR